MSSLPNVGPCKFCDAHATRTCSVCGEFYCCQACQMQDWPRHKEFCCRPDTTKGVSYPSGDEMERARQKAFNKVSQWHHQIANNRNELRFCLEPHPGLVEAHTADWMRVMKCWEPTAKREIHQFVSSARFEWNMGLFGSVTYEGVFNRKATTLTLYKKRHTPYHWMIMYEPLSNDPNIFFDDLHAFMASCPAIMLGSVI